VNPIQEFHWWQGPKVAIRMADLQSKALDQLPKSIEFRTTVAARF